MRAACGRAHASLRARRRQAQAEAGRTPITPLSLVAAVADSVPDDAVVVDESISSGGGLRELLKARQLDLPLSAPDGEPLRLLGRARRTGFGGRKGRGDGRLEARRARVARGEGVDVVCDNVGAPVFADPPVRWRLEVQGDHIVVFGNQHFRNGMLGS